MMLPSFEGFLTRNSKINLSRWSFRCVLYKTSDDDEFATVLKEDYARFLLCRQAGTHLIDAVAQGTAERNPDRKSDLDQAQVEPDHAAFLGQQGLEPLAHRLVASGGTKELNGKHDLSFIWITGCGGGKSE